MASEPGIANPEKGQNVTTFEHLLSHTNKYVLDASYNAGLDNDTRPAKDVRPREPSENAPCISLLSLGKCDKPEHHAPSPRNTCRKAFGCTWLLSVAVVEG